MFKSFFCEKRNSGGINFLDLVETSTILLKRSYFCFAD